MHHILHTVTPQIIRIDQHVPRSVCISLCRNYWFSCMKLRTMVILLIRSSYLPYLLSLLVLLAFLYKSFLAANKPDRNQPPSPRKLPVIGNLHQLGLSPHRSLRALAQNNGSLMLLHFGTKPVLIASSADVAREIMKTHDLFFSSRPHTSIPCRLTYNAKDIAFAPYGEYWRKTKSIGVLQLLSNKRVQSFQQVREEELALLINEIKNITSSSSSSLVNLSDLFITLTNDVVCRVALGRKYGGKKFKKLLNDFTDLLGVFRVGDYIPWLSWVDVVNGLNARVEKTAKELDEFLEGVVEEHLNRKSREASGGASDEGERQDFVDIFLEIQRENTMGFPIDRDTIKAVILDMFVAGTDTVFTAIEWTMAELLRHPKAMKKLQNEVRGIGRGRSELITEDDFEKLHYLKAVIRESLRLHPPIPLLIPRESTQEVKLMGYNIPAGTQAYINAWAIGRDPTSWEDPEEFKPERFMDSSIDFKGLDYELIPFGAGRRGCPGIKFGMNIIELVLANVVHKFDFALPGGGRGEDLDMNEVGGITVHMKSPLMVVAKPHSC